MAVCCSWCRYICSIIKPSSCATGQYFGYFNIFFFFHKTFFSHHSHIHIHFDSALSTKFLGASHFSSYLWFLWLIDIMPLLEPMMNFSSEFKCVAVFSVVPKALRRAHIWLLFLYSFWSVDIYLTPFVCLDYPYTSDPFTFLSVAIVIPLWPVTCPSAGPLSGHSITKRVLMFPGASRTMTSADYSPRFSHIILTHWVL